MRPTMFALATASSFALAPALAIAQQQWGNIKGRVIWNGKNVPAPKAIKNNGCPCAKPVVDNVLLINAESKGVANVAVWLVPVAGAKMPIHPKLAAAPGKAAVIDQPSCLFEPRVTMIRAGQRLEIHNSSAIAHNANVAGHVNVLIPAGGKTVFDAETALKPAKKAIALSCNIHNWMGGQIHVFDHPYFALTDKDGNFEIKDAPAGDCLIYISHESVGWLHSPRVAKNGVGGSNGQPITVPADDTLNLPKIKFDPKFLP